MWEVRDVCDEYSFLIDNGGRDVYPPVHGGFVHPTAAPLLCDQFNVRDYGRVADEPAPNPNQD